MSSRGTAHARLTPWPVSEHRGPAAALHALDVPAVPGRALRLLRVTRPAVVLGSAQPAAAVDGAAAARAGLDVVRRRTGGGAVVVEPGRLVWVDVVVPAVDPLWQADVGRAFWWLGEAWAAALADVGVDGAVAHRGPLGRSRWSSTVCFAALGPGEVSVEGRKVVGMAQRRTRRGALFQCAVPLAWEPATLLDVLALDPRERAGAVADLTGAVRAVAGVAPADLETALAAHLPGSSG